MSIGAPDPSATVVVVNFNRRQDLQECLQSLCNQTTYEGHPLPVALVVVDNGSSDGSAAMVEREFPAARLIRNTANHGFCRANNQGIALAETERIALLNNDAVAHPHWLAALSEALDRAPRVGMAASKILSYDDPGIIDKAGHIIFPDGQNRGRGSGERDLGQYDREEEVLWPDGCAAMYRRSMLTEIGAFDEDLFAYADDAELGLRARIGGWRCWYTPRALVRHRRGATLGRGNPRRVFLIERNRVLLAMKLFPWSLLLRNPYYYALRLLGAARGGAAADLADFPGWRGKLRVLATLLRADLAALWLAPRFLAKRREVRRHARLSSRELHQLILPS